LRRVGWRLKALNWRGQSPVSMAGFLAGRFLTRARSFQAAEAAIRVSSKVEDSCCLRAENHSKLRRFGVELLMTSHRGQPKQVEQYRSGKRRWEFFLSSGYEGIESRPTRTFERAVTKNLEDSDSRARKHPRRESLHSINFEFFRVSQELTVLTAFFYCLLGQRS